MSYEYKPYVKLKTNVDKSKLKYTLGIWDSVNQKYINLSTKKRSYRIDYNRKYNFLESGSNLRTDCVILNYPGNYPPIEDLRDYVLIFNLYRIDEKNQEHHVIKNYFVNNLIEDFEKNRWEEVKLDVINYKETNKPNQVVNVENKYTVTVEIPNQSIFKCKDIGYESGTTKDPFRKKSVEASVFSRLKEPYPDQGNTNLCGPAAFFYCLLTSAPKVYIKNVKELWEKGETTISKLKIKPLTSGARSVSNFIKKSGNPRISVVDWITMASLRDTSNKVTRYNKASGEGKIGDIYNGLTAFTMPHEVHDWFIRAGFEVPYYKSNFNSSGNIYKLDWIDNIKKLVNYPSKEYYYVFLTNSKVIEGEEGDVNKYTPVEPSHYIVINTPIRIKKTNAVIDLNVKSNDVIYAGCFNWGKQDRIKQLTLNQFLNTVWALIVVKREYK